jgi:DNA-binding transcriptional LysR family regulator
MHFNQLIYFKKVSETGSISRAAAGLLLTQPAVSKQIKALEDELGERLFDRIGKKMFLTMAGEVLASHVDRILRSIDEAKAAVRDISAECAGELVIGASDHISIHRLPDVLKAYISAFPRVDLKLHCHRSETIFEMVGKNLVDLGVITLPRIAPNMICKTVWKDPMSLVFAKDHPLKSLRRIRLVDTLKCGMILPERGTETRSMIEEAYAHKRLSPNITMEVVYIETIKSLVRAGMGISILPDKAVETEVKSGMIIRTKIVDVELSRDLGVVCLKEKFLSRPATEFLNILDRT